MTTPILRRIGSIAAGLAFLTQAHPAAQNTAPAYKDPKLPVEARVEDLLARMTLEEKVAQMLSIWENKADVFDARMEFDPAKMALKYPNGIGTFARPSDATGPSSPSGSRRIFPERFAS
jgi:beta-glucosidase